MENQVTNNNGVKFCRNCGAQIPVEWAFCTACGQASATSVTQPADALAPAHKSGKKWMIAVIAVVVAIAVVVGCVLLFGKTDYEEAFDDFLAVYFEGDFSKIEGTIPAEMWNDYQDGHVQKLTNDPEMSQEWKENMEEAVISYSIAETRELSSMEIYNISSALYSNTGYSIDSDEAYEFQLEVDTYEGYVPYLSDEVENNKVSLYVVKVQGKWYVVSDRKGNGTLNFATERMIDKLE